MAEKRFYWFKMEQSFFEQKEIKYLRKLPGGDTYTIIYLKLILKSLENNGKLYYENIGDNYIQEWALEIEEDEKALNFLVGFLINKGLIVDCGFDEFEVTKTKTLVGSETASAERKRRQRERERAIEPTKCVTMSQVSHIESDIESDIEIDKESESEKNNTGILIKDIFDFYQSNFGIISPSKSEQLREFTEENPKELVLEALKSADNYNAKSPIDYASSILNQWARKNIKSLEDVETERKLRSKKSSNIDKPVKPAPKWASNGKEPEEEEMTPEEAEAFFNGH